MTPTSSPQNRRLLIVGITISLSLFLLFAVTRFAAAAPTATFTVNSTSDDGDNNPGDGDCDTGDIIIPCSLRAAIEEANALPGADIILINSPIVSDFTPATPYSVTSEITINGSGVGIDVVDGQDNTQLFVVSAEGNLTLRALTLQNGIATQGGAVLNNGTFYAEIVSFGANDATGPAPTDGGGALYNNGTATLSDTTFLNNTAVITSGSGGGIFNTGILTATNSRLSANRAARAGGAIETIADATVYLDSVTLDGNSAGPMPGNGGALHMTGAGTVTVINSIVSNNTATTEGGGLWNGTGTMTVTNTTLNQNSAEGVEAHDGGGALFNNGGTLLVTDSAITNNDATGTSGSGGGVFNNTGGSVTINGGSISENNANRAGGALEDNGTPPADAPSLGENMVVLNDVDMEGNSAGMNPGNGGAVHITGPGNVTLNGGEVLFNTSVEGGGLWNSAVGTLSVSNVTFDNNSAAGNDPDQGGGAVFSDGGTTSVVSSTLTNNSAVGTSGSGGAILNVNGGDLTVTGSSLMNNSAMRAGGGIEDNSTLAATNTTVSDTDVMSNTVGANPGNGGGYHMTGAGSASFTDGRVAGNTAASEGGGLWNGTGTMTVTNTLVENNSAAGAAADNGGGGLFNSGGVLNVTDATIQGNTATGAAGSGGGIFNDVGGTLTVLGGTINSNTSVRAGGGIEDNAGASSTLVGVDISRNTTGDAPGNGGGLHITGAGNVTVRDSVIANNTATEGGGLWNSAAGTLTVDGSTINNNTADGAADGQDGGGGIYSDGVLAVFNSTISANTTVSAGGGVSLVGAAANGTLTHVTLYQNNADAGASGLANDGGSAIVANSIIAHVDTTGDDCSGNITDTVPNLATDTTCSASLIGNPMLAALADNGGPTMTHALMVGSIALDTADTTVCTTAPVTSLDQRDMVRPMGEACDLGAYESSELAPTDAQVYFPLIQRAGEE